MEILIRPFEPSDMDRLYFLDQRCHEEGLRITYSKWLSALLERDVSVLVAVESTGDRPEPLRACLLLQAEPWRQQVKVLALMVDPEVRRQGLASRLLDWAARLGERLQMRELSLLQESEDPALLGLLNGRGFRRTDELALGLRSAEPRPVWSLALAGGVETAELPTEP